jgi:hypothetical protein
MCDSDVTKQMSPNQIGSELNSKRTALREFLDEMGLELPCAEVLSLFAARSRSRGAKGGHPPFTDQPLFWGCDA